MFRAFAGAFFCLSFQGDVCRTHDPLPQVIEAMPGVVRDLLRQIHTPVALLVMLREIGQAVQLVENGHHVARPGASSLGAAHRGNVDCVGLGEVVVFWVVNYDEATCL